MSTTVLRGAALVGVLSIELLGCHEAQLRTRAAFDFQCSEKELKLTPLPNDQEGVEGCGHRGVYVLTPSGWVANTDQPRQGEPTPKAAQ